jgi:hypothetical protein
MDLDITQEILDKSVYKRTTRTKDKVTGEVTVRQKGEPHKGKQRKVDILRIQLEGTE